MWKCGWLEKKEVIPYCVAQIVGAILGVWLVHLMFGLDIIQFATKSRGTIGMFFSEIIATIFLLLVIYFGVKNSKACVACLVALLVTTGYWFTSSTFFANPAVTIARCLTDTFVGIIPEHVPIFLTGQLLALLLCLRIIAKLNDKTVS